MTIRTITFHFDKNPASLDLRFLEAHEGPSLVPVDRDDISYAVSYIFDQLIARNKAVYYPPILSLSTFAATLTINPLLSHPTLDIDPMNPTEVPVTLEKLKKETTALFLKAMKGSRTPSVETTVLPRVELLPDRPLPIHPKLPAQEEIAPLSPEEFGVGGQIVQTASLQPAVQKIAPLSPEDFETIVNLNPVEMREAAFAAAKASTGEGICAVAALPPRQHRTPQEEAFGILSSQMHAQFNFTVIQRPDKPTDEPFGLYLMDRFFGKAKSISYDIETQDFVLNFETAQKIKLAKLPEGKSEQELASLKLLQGATLAIPKTVRGKFNIKEGQLSFQPGSLKLEWKFSSAQLLGIFEAQGCDNTIIMQIKYMGLSQQGPVNAQDFVDIIECNL